VNRWTVTSLPACLSATATVRDADAGDDDDDDDDDVYRI